MRYPLQRKFKPEFPMPEEEQVFDALKAFTFNPDQTAVTDFTPTSVLYDAYMQLINQLDYATSPESPEVLNPKQFGAALRRVFDLDDDRQTRRRIGRKRMIGYLFVRGPGSFKVHNGPGNPQLVRHAPTAPTPAAA